MRILFVDPFESTLFSFRKELLDTLIENKFDILSKFLDLSKYNDIILLTEDNFMDEKYARYDFQKIYQSYTRKINAVTYDNQIKAMIRDNILKLMKKKNITNYRVYKELNANAGNINDFLKNNKVNKVSLETAKRIYSFCLSY